METIKDLVNSIRQIPCEVMAMEVKTDKNYRQISYQKFYDQIKYLGNTLIDRGISKGDNIGLLAENSIEWPIVYLAVTSIGATIVPVSILWQSAEIESVIETAKIKYFFVSDIFFPKVNSVFQSGDKSRSIILMGRDSAECNESTVLSDVQKMIQEGEILEKKGAFDSEIQVNREDIAEILFVSGKIGVKISHRAILSNAEGIIETMGLKNKPGCKIMTILPYSHLYPTVFGILIPIFVQWTVITAATTQMNVILRIIKDKTPNSLILVPLLLERLCQRIKSRLNKTENRQQMERFKNLEFIFSAGVKCPFHLMESFKDLGIKVLEGYGVSEMSPFISVNTPSCYQLGTAGLPLKNIQLKILSDSDKKDGEILVRGPGQMSGYLSAEKLNTADGALKTDSQGWLNTGDIGYINEHGYLNITGRKRNILVNKGGNNIYPEEIERILLTSLLISKVKIRQDVHQENGEVPIAYIVPDLEKLPDSKEINMEELKTLLKGEMEKFRDQIAPYKFPKDFKIVNEGEYSQVVNQSMTL